MADDTGALIVVGAALGAGRWLADQALAARVRRSADGSAVANAGLDPGAAAGVDGAAADGTDGIGGTVVLVDLADAVDQLPAVDGVARAAVLDERGLRAADGGPALPSRCDAAIVAVPPAALDGVLRRLRPLLGPSAEVVVVANPMAPAVDALLAAAPAAGWAAHLLFDPALTPGEGQGAFVAPVGPEGPACPAWFAALLATGGAVLRTGPAAAHDAAMAVVQALTHRTLVAFADAVVASPVPVDDLWALRTPLFDSLLGLTSRALDPRQQAQVAGLQAGDGAAHALLAAAGRGAEDLDAAAARARDGISGALFDELRTTAAAGIRAAQARRSEVGRHARDRAVVGLRRVGAPDSVRVGRIVEVTATEVVLEVLLAGPPGRGAMLAGPGAGNAARLGVGGTRARQAFGVGHVEVLGDRELQALLDERLAFVPRDVRFLVPESVAGSGVARVVAQAEGLRDVRLVDEVVRTGQRSVVVHLAVRADRDVDAVVEAVRRQVERAYAWPLGVTAALAGPEARVVYLGPAGTFSEVAARQAAERLGVPADRIEAMASFDEVLAAVRPGTVGVLPVTSSSSGLVGRAADALLAAAGRVEAAGVVDVAVRFDAYANADGGPERFRGARVFSHPQGLAQCTRFVARWGLVPVPTASTADAVQRVLEADGPALALGGVGLTGALRVLEREVDDLSGSITRFLVLGAEGGFAPARDGSDPTLRAVWIGADVRDAAALVPAGEAAFSELLTDAAGRFLLVTSARPVAGAAAHLLGVLPWSPRTPLVRPAS